MAVLQKSRLKLVDGKGPLWASPENNTLFHFDHWPEKQKTFVVPLLGKTYHKRTVMVRKPGGKVERRVVYFHILGDAGDSE